MIRAALLDMDGTLFDTERLYMEGWIKGSQKYGYELTLGQICAFHGRSARDNEALYKSWFGEDAPYWEVRKIRTEYMKEKLRKEGVPLKPGLFDLLNTLREKHITICIATGTGRADAEERWRNAGIAGYVDASVCGDEVTKSKPDPEIFLRAASKAGENPGDCIVFEDSLNGVRAGHSAGCHVFAVPDIDPVTPEMEALADRIFPTLGSAAAVIRTWPAAEGHTRFSDSQ